MTAKANKEIIENKPLRKQKKIKDCQVGFKMTADDAEELKLIAERLGGMAVASMLRIAICNKIDEVKRTGDPKKFIE